MSIYSTKAYVVGEEINEETSQTSYGVVIYHNGERVYKCTSLTHDITVAQRFADLINQVNCL